MALVKSFAWQSQSNSLIVSSQYIAEIMHLLISSVRSHRCGGCDESVSGTGLNTSSYNACIWLKAIGQEVIHLTAEDFIASLDIDRCQTKGSYPFAAVSPQLIDSHRDHY